MVWNITCFVPNREHYHREACAKAHISCVLSSRTWRSDYLACLGSNLERLGKFKPADELCNLCRNLNLRTESFTDYHWRHPSSFETCTSVRQDDLDRIQLKNGEFFENVTARFPDIVTLPTLYDQVIYTDEFMGQFDKEHTVDSSRREPFAPTRRESLGMFEDTVRRESCSLCSLFADVPKRFGLVSDNARSVLGSYPCGLSFSWKENGGQSFSTIAWADSISQMGRNTVFAISILPGYISSYFH